MPTTEQLEIQALAREFAESELRPRARGWDERRALDDDVFAKLAELGFLGMLVSEEHGGLGFDFPTYLLVLEELAAGDASVALSVAVHNGPVATLLARHGSEAQRQRWLPALASGEAVGAFALSEPGAGSDASSVETRATRDGDGWRLAGEKRWITNGARAGVVVVFARVEEEGEGSVGAFLVTPAAEGYTVGKRERTLGLRASETVSVTLHDVAVAADAVVGDPSVGAPLRARGARPGQGGVRRAGGRDRAGRARACSRLRARARAVRQTHRALRRDPGEARAHGGAGRGGARAHARGGRCVQAATSGGHPRTGLRRRHRTRGPGEGLGLGGRDLGRRRGHPDLRGLRLHAALPGGALLRDAKGTEIFEGTSEIMRHVIARELLRDAGDSNE
jgi:alkylation response protein AidB-like acyl-CoA dehydrogenase